MWLFLICSGKGTSLCTIELTDAEYERFCMCLYGCLSLSSPIYQRVKKKITPIYHFGSGELIMTAVIK